MKTTGSEGDILFHEVSMVFRLFLLFLLGLLGAIVVGLAGHGHGHGVTVVDVVVVVGLLLS
jgi:hypothetical protein